MQCGQRLRRSILFAKNRLGLRANIRLNDQGPVTGDYIVFSEIANLTIHVFLRFAMTRTTTPAMTDYIAINGQHRSKIHHNPSLTQYAA
jgi:hypothetical protein